MPEYLRGYPRSIYLTLTAPSRLAAWPPAPAALLPFLIPNVGVGMAIMYYLMDPDNWADIPVWVSFRFLMWVVMGSGLFGLAKFLDGRGRFFDTFAITMHVAGVAFLLTMAALLLLSGSLRLDLLAWHIDGVADESKRVSADPINIFFGTSLLAGATILPMALGSLHEFKAGRKSLLAVPALLMLVGWINYIVQIVQAQR